ncbi:type II toxin-antitoxin system PemK/MazF family toxin [Methanofollis fontis]|nr:type II toxin-antitoxin system PemK/MazF family toxin [Methanofollis fontis]
MGRYVAGDVVLARLGLGNGGDKVRPAVVIGPAEQGTIVVCPVSSRAPGDAPVHPIALDDFVSGGLDLFDESYVLTVHPCTIRVREVVGKKGRLKPEAFGPLGAAVRHIPSGR